MPDNGAALGSQFTVLAYPFQHAVTGPGRKSQLVDLGDRWMPWWGRLSPESLVEALDDSYFFLPYLREMLFPETNSIPVANPREQVRDASWLSRLTPGELADRAPESTVVRLTYRGEAMAGLRSPLLRLERKGEDGAILDSFESSFQVDWIDVVLFPQRVGFLLLKIRVEPDGLTVDRLSEFLSLIRLVHPPRPGWTLATWHAKAGVDTISFEARDLIDFLLDGFTRIPPRGASTLAAFVRGRRNSPSLARYTESRLGQAYGTIFHLFGYARTGDGAGGDDRDPGPFGTHLRRWLYELATCTDAANPEQAPHPSQVEATFHRQLIAHWSNWLGLPLQDNVAFLGIGASPWTDRRLPYNIESDYLYLYLLALYQKTRLSVMFGELLRRDADPVQNLEEARALWKEFLMFQNRYWYSEVTRRPLASEIYDRFRAGLGVLRLYEEMTEQVHELHEYYTGLQQQRTGRNLGLLTWICAPMGILASFFGAPLLEGKVPGWWFALATAGTYAVLVAASRVAGRWLRT